MIYILGLSAFYHDSAACLLVDGKIRAAAQEERFTRKRHDASFPIKSVHYCLSEAGIDINQIDYFIFYDKPLLKFERILETYLFNVPKGIRSFLKSMPLWIKQKLLLPKVIEKELKTLGLKDKLSNQIGGKIFFSDHHLSHAASAFFPSPFEEAAVLTVDGVGEWATTSLGIGSKNHLEIIKEIHFPHSLGLLYSAFTYQAGFKVNSGEYKLMGLAPYGKPTYVNKIYDHLIQVCEDGSFLMNLDYFDYSTGLKMTNSKFDALFDGPPRKLEAPVTQREMDLAQSVQVVLEDVMLRLVHFAKKETQSDNLCLAGGVALNCVANGELLRRGPFKKIWIQPAAGDAGGALGCALLLWYELLGQPRQVNPPYDSMEGSYLGPSYSDEQIFYFLKKEGIPFEFLEGDLLPSSAARLIGEGKVVGWFQGRMEFGPRSLGARSILGDPRNPQMQSIMNLKIKYRESFRPFAPAVLQDRVSDYFEFSEESPYMLFVAPVSKKYRSTFPAVTHVDCSARLQTVTGDQNPIFYQLLKKFEAQTGCGLLINTSFNVRGEPIVCTPQEAYRCFMRTEMDYLVLGSYLLDRKKQPAFQEAVNWRSEFELD
ncbi:MAG: hypothetical protein A3G32_03515 [Deltaproteobacteria bacterium RIFCSPLOWO2_12_FULL_40_28]|nr:MAG: hypothetical protein A3C45_02200 [Deltaproteobacteria bacterium RIFCSPHIGHO2_02_FULL_40_28]OGQ20161.1 MAG: hypothetical protein A3E27_01495 [Deltaproteobacteria bacterium RIFCSPHIGHO2_12_FULL_40_32]OGQ40732.1 MAG: hypothetical protein A3I69_02760 [Deltaproteobacteria bacterium RIFCSPLOWO2_02_FULL_40_36]OGQ54428.1 MAG: hypothetical protein A3G32_03515 [Deltaproteobacteria bacterium RIFCSPLOWO2_12_FULL_40_28]